MISFIALALYLTLMLIVMHMSVVAVDNRPGAFIETIILVAIVSGVPALLGMLNGMNFEKKHGRHESSKSN